MHVPDDQTCIKVQVCFSSIPLYCTVQVIENWNILHEWLVSSHWTFQNMNFDHFEPHCGRFASVPQDIVCV